MRVLLLGDICGRPGRDIVKEKLPEIRSTYQPDLVIANGENAAGGFGLTKKIAEELFGLGIDVITSGNHIWDKREIYPYLGAEARLLRPANYPPSVPGNYLYYAKVGEQKVAVINLIGRVFMGDFDCPFRKIDEILAETSSVTPISIIDFHGEATSEKQAFGWYVDGRASVVVGTHTHVPTADERILPGGTAYVTDLGMCGPMDGILGMQREPIIRKFTDQLPTKFSVAKGDRHLCGVLVDIDSSGKALKISRIYYEKKIM
ncbi:MAG TPA: TIGR00282 family metallophosphoesterase [Firmicutes bacterium]|nr:TIGR00282 family metallophosphoesterase [Bacillota bacterium]